MDYLYGVGIALHTLAAVVWVGGMFFAHMVLRPATAEMAPPERLALWARVFPRFFRWVWLAILTLLVTGYGVLLTGYRGGIGGGALHVDIMQVTGLTMVALFVVLFVVQWPMFRRAVAAGDHQRAAGLQARIRHIVAINLGLGLFTVLIGVVGTFIGY